MKRKVLSLLLTLFLAITLAPIQPTEAASSIPDGAKEYNGNYYYLYTQSSRWAAAKDNCEAVGGHLATITSKKELDFIFKTFNLGSHGYWIGGTKESGFDRPWKWVTGEKWKYTSWSSGSPKKLLYPDCNYLSIWSSGWVDMENSYGDLSGYICEWDGTDITTSLPDQASISSVKKASSTSVNVTWKEIIGAEGYTVYMKTGADGSFKKIADIDSGDVTTYNKSKLKSGITYYFRVRAYKTIYGEKSYGDLSTTKKITLQ